MDGSLFDPADCAVLGDDLTDEDFEDILAEPAGAVVTLLPDYDPADEDSETVVEARAPGWLARIILEEGTAGFLKKKFDEEKHPRWPKGTPHAGEFMRVGEWFHADGKDWQIIHTGDKSLTAIEASGESSAVEERQFTAKAIKGEAGVAVPGVAPSQPKPFDRYTSPVVVPYVKPETHDPSLTLPGNSAIGAKAWKRFGKDDQEYYLSLQERFGAWEPGKSKQMFSKIWKTFDTDVQNAIEHAYNAQYSSSGYWDQGAGKWLNLAYMLAKSGTAWTQYQKVKVAMDEMNEVVHWDLYNRTKSPDITLFHGGGSGVHAYKNLYISGEEPIYAGFSQSYAFTGGTGWGSTVLMTPVAIRHVALSYYTPLPVGSAEDMGGEREVSVGVRMKLDDRSVAFDSGTMGQPGNSLAIQKWIKGETEQQPAPGTLVEQLKAIWNGTGPVPIPPQKSELTPFGQGEGKKGYKELPPDIEAQAGKLAHTLKYKSDDGSKEAAVGILDGMGLKPGDFIEGKQGTRYIIVKDSADSTSGLRYVKIEAHGTVNYSKSWPFSSSAGNEFYRLDGHIDIPEKKEKGYQPLSDEELGKLNKGALTQLKDLQADQVVLIDDAPYKVVTPASMGSTTIGVENVKTGKKFTANKLYKGIPLVTGPGDAFTPPDEWEEGDPVLVTLPKGTFLGKVSAKVSPKDYAVSTLFHGPGVLAASDQLAAAPTLPNVDTIEPGDKFALDGKGPYTVTSVLKGGIVRAKLSGGKVEKFTPSDLKAKTTVWRPSHFAVGDQESVGGLGIGDVVQGGTGKTLRPYMVVSFPSSSASGKDAKIALLNLETGVVSAVAAKKKYKRLVTAKDIAKKDEELSAPPEPSEKPGAGQLVVDLFPTFKDIPVGTKFYSSSPEMVYEVTAPGTLQWTSDDGVLHTKVYDPDYKPKSWTIVSLPAAAAPKGPKVEDGKFDKSKYEEGEEAKLSDLPVGSLFVSATGLPMQLKSKAPKGGATALALHNGKTVKNISYDKPFKTLVEKEEPLFDHDALKPGDSVLLKNLKAGDKLKQHSGTNEELVVTEDPTPSLPIKLKQLKADGTLGYSTQWGEVNKVIYLGKHEPHMEGSPAPKVAQKTDYHADKLALAPEYETYLHPKSGKHKYPLVSSMPAGTIFTDKGGVAWKVKQTGGQTVITDGIGLYKVDEGWRGKVDEDGTVAFIDHTNAGEEPVDGGPVLGDLKVGDKFKVPAGYGGAGDEYEVVDTTPTFHPALSGHADDHPNYGAFTTIKVKPVGSTQQKDFSTTLPAVGVTPGPALTKPAYKAGDLIKVISSGKVFPIAEVPPDGGLVLQVGDIKLPYTAKSAATALSGGPSKPTWELISQGRAPVIPSEGEVEKDVAKPEGSFGLVEDLPVGQHYAFKGASGGPQETVYKVVKKDEQGTHVEGNGVTTIIAPGSELLEKPILLPGTEEIVENPLQPWQNKTKANSDLGDLEPGTKFKDKTGKVFQVTGHVGANTQFTGAGGSFSAPGSSKVKPVAPPIEEASYAMDSFGRLRAAA